MHAGPELKSKLLRRQQLEQESACQQRSTSPTGEAAALDSEIRMVLEQRDAAIRQQREIEAASVARSIETGAEVARLRVEAEVLRRGVESASNEMYKLRADKSVEARRESWRQEQSLQTGEDLTAAEGRCQALLGEVQGRQTERTVLEEQVGKLEAAVAQQVASRMRLEALLRQCEQEEADLRRAVQSAKQAVPKLQPLEEQYAGAEQRIYALDDSEDEFDGQCAESAAADDWDLEWTYEGLELSALMSLDKAMQLARKGTTAGSSLQGSGLGQADDSDDGSADAHPAGLGGGNDPYEEHVKALELALARVRSGGGQQQQVGPALAVSEEADYAEQLGQLQEVLSRMEGSSTSSSPAKQQPSSTADAAKHPKLPEEEEPPSEPPPPLPPEAAKEIPMPLKAEPEQAEPEQAEPEEVEPEPEEEAPAATAAETASVVGAHPLLSGGQRLLAIPRAAPVSGFSLFSPYAALAGKYQGTLPGR